MQDEEDERARESEGDDRSNSGRKREQQSGSRDLGSRSQRGRGSALTGVSRSLARSVHALRDSVCGDCVSPAAGISRRQESRKQKEREAEESKRNSRRLLTIRQTERRVLPLSLSCVCSRCVARKNARERSQGASRAEGLCSLSLSLSFCRSRTHGGSCVPSDKQRVCSQAVSSRERETM